MCYLIKGYVKNEIDILLMNVGLTRFLSSVSIKEGGGIEGFSGFAADFPVQSEERFSLNGVLDNHKITIICWLEIPESEYSEIEELNKKNIEYNVIGDKSISFSITEEDKNVSV